MHPTLPTSRSLFSSFTFFSLSLLNATQLPPGRFIDFPPCPIFSVILPYTPSWAWVLVQHPTPPIFLILLSRSNIRPSIFCDYSSALPNQGNTAEVSCQNSSLLHGGRIPTTTISRSLPRFQNILVVQFPLSPPAFRPERNSFADAFNPDCSSLNFFYNDFVLVRVSLDTRSVPISENIRRRQPQGSCLYLVFHAVVVH